MKIHIGTLWRTTLEKLSVGMMLLVLAIVILVLWKEFLFAGIGVMILSVLSVIWYRLGCEQSVIHQLKKHHGQQGITCFPQRHLQQAVTRLEKKQIIKIVGHQITLIDRNIPCAYDKFAQQKTRKS